VLRLRSSGTGIHEGENILADAPQLQQPADELVIRNLVSNLAHMAAMAAMAPEDHLDGYVAPFTDDARWEMPGSLRQGRDDILAGVLDRRKNGIQGPGTNTRHLITTHDVRVDGGTATGNAYFMLVADTSRSGTAHSPCYTSGPQAGCRSDGGRKDPCRSAPTVVVRKSCR
jgi:hypothetical protein